jgi:guanine deaminase
MRPEDYMEKAIDAARRGIRRGQTPFGACIVMGSEIVCTAHNEVWLRNDITAHAEIRAIQKACREMGTIDLSGCEIYSTCEPCPMCFSACHWARISKIVFGASIADAQNYGFRELAICNEDMKALGKDDDIELEGGFMREENIKLFETWAGQKGKKTY